MIFLVGNLFAIGSLNNIYAPSFCCEKTTDGAWCQNAEENQCATGFVKSPTSCESTSYCKLGCCYNSQEGTCMENTPQKVCDSSNGSWEDSASCEIPECGLGCCTIGDEAAFVTQTRCKRLANLYGVDVDYRTDLRTEIQCIASITSDVEGACVYEKEFEQTCLRATKKDCANTIKGTFYEGRLCSDEKLATTCAADEKLATTCVEGEDIVYFVDSCGNKANVYDSSPTKINDADYWAKIYNIEESCGYGNSNAGSNSCGNCDYFLGSTCKAYDKTIDSNAPDAGDNICRDLSCTWEGKTYQHGETWCYDKTEMDKSLPGSRQFRLVCYDNEVTVEPCSDYRAETCLESKIVGADGTEFSVAGCVENKWQDCFLQLEEQDCNNTDKRDCKWITGISVTGSNGKTQSEVCVPQYAPGLDFWNTQGDAATICGKGSAQCTVTYEKKLIGGTKCVSGCECLTSDWENNMAQVCNALGDCGNKVNYLGYAGYEENKTYITTSEVESSDK